MTFESLYIKSFGNLLEKKIVFNDGINIIEGANESGKSTVCSFIHFIFYGLPPQSDEKMQYLNWKTLSASGSIMVRENGARYRIEREVNCEITEEGKKQFRENCNVYVGDTKTLHAMTRSPGEFFFGVSSCVFESTVYIRQASGNALETKTLGDEAENILFSGNERLNTTRAIAKLDSTRKSILQKDEQGGELFILKEKRKQMADRLQNAQSGETDIISLEGSHRVLTENSAHLKKKIADIQSQQAEHSRYRTKKTYLRCESEKEKLTKAEEQMLSLRYPVEHESIAIADPPYIEMLEQKQRGLSLAQARLIDAQKDLKVADAKITEMSEKLSVFAKLGENEPEQRNALVQSIESNQTKMGRCNFIAIILGICAVFAMVLALIFRNDPSFHDLFKYLFVTACLLLATAAAYFFFMKKHDYAIEIENICKQFNCQNYEEVKELIKASSADEVYMLALRKMRSEKKEKLRAVADELDTLSTKIISILQDANFRIFENAPVSLTHALEKCRDVQAKIQALKSRIKEHRSNIESLKNELTANSEEYVRDAISAQYDEQAMEAFDMSGTQKELDALNENLESYVTRIHEIEVELAARRAVSTDPTAIAEEIAVLDHEIQTLTEKWKACVLAAKTLNTASGKLRDGITPKLARSASKSFAAMTDGKHESIGLNAEFALSFSEGNAMHKADCLSAGTGDLAYICLRMALIELLYKSSIPPLLFDESFARMDDNRLEKVLSRIFKYSQKNYQCILLTCHAREKNAMQAIGAHHVISL